PPGYLCSVIDRSAGSTLSLHDALPILSGSLVVTAFRGLVATVASAGPLTPQGVDNYDPASNEGYFIGVDNLVFSLLQIRRVANPDRKSTRLNSSHLGISYAVFCLKTKK